MKNIFRELQNCIGLQKCRFEKVNERSIIFMKSLKFNDNIFIDKINKDVIFLYD